MVFDGIADGEDDESRAEADGEFARSAGALAFDADQESDDQPPGGFERIEEGDKVQGEKSETRSTKFETSTKFKTQKRG